MTEERFQRLITELMERQKLVMGAKEAEYSTPYDRLINFRQRAFMMGTSPVLVAISDLTKHIQSIALAARTGKGEWAWHTKDGGEGLKQRIIDIIGLTFLVAAAFEEAWGDETVRMEWTRWGASPLSRPEQVDTESIT